MKYIDIHSHVNFKAYDDDRAVVINRALDSDTWVINVGTQFDTSKKAVEITNEYEEGVYATVGLHPIHTGASFHDESELGSEGAEFTSRGEIFDKEKYKADPLKHCEYYQGEICQEEECMRDPQICIGTCEKVQK